MTTAEDAELGAEALSTLYREDETRNLVGGSHVSISWGVFAGGVGFVTAGTNQTEFLVPHGGWLTLVNAAVDGDGWTEGGGEVRLMVTRDEVDVELYSFTFDPDNKQDTTLERVQLQAGDMLFVEADYTDTPAPDAEIIVTLTTSMGLYRRGGRSFA